MIYEHWILETVMSNLQHDWFKLKENTSEPPPGLSALYDLTLELSLNNCSHNLDMNYRNPDFGTLMSFLA